MCTKASVAVLLILSATLLTGCSVSYRTDNPDIPPKTTTTQLREDVRLANERARLAEERAELEQRKRQLAEERLKRPSKTEEDDKSKEPVDKKETRGS